MRNEARVGLQQVERCRRAAVPNQRSWTNRAGSSSQLGLRHAQQYDTGLANPAIATEWTDDTHAGAGERLRERAAEPPAADDRGGPETRVTR